MRFGTIATFVASLSLTGVSARRSAQHVGRYDESLPQPRMHRGVPFDRWTRSGPVENKFQTANTTKFLLNSTAIPDVDFDIGEAYAGQLSINDKHDSEDKFFFWFQPSPNPAAEKEIVIWLNGGPGCSSLEGLIQENGPFLWQYGTYKPIANPWSWHHLSNILWVEQPIGTGFSTGNVTITNEKELAAQFLGFYKNFVDTFALQGYKVYITGESYAGFYCPYIASAMLDEKDESYFNVKGMTIYDPSVANDQIMNNVPVVPFVEANRNLFPFNESFSRHIHRVDEQCGFAALREKHLQYPPPGHLPSPLPGYDKHGKEIPECSSLWNDIFLAILEINPCFDIYQIATTCPILWDVLGFPGSMDYLPQGASVYFDREDVKKAIHAPTNVPWSSCSPQNSFAGDGSDNSDYPTVGVLASVIDRTQNVIVGHGALDFVLLANGTLLGIQNMTFGGKLGFQKRPKDPFYVPYHHDESNSTLAGAGVFGTTHTERGLTYVGINLSGHMVPQYAPSAGFRHLEYMLGRVDSLSSEQPFTTDPHYTQPKGSPGHGTHRS